MQDILRSCRHHRQLAGHINFNDEVTAGMRLADGVLLVVDAVEGVMLVTDKAIKQAAAEGLPTCLMLSKVRCAPCICLRRAVCYTHMSSTRH